MYVSIVTERSRDEGGRIPGERSCPDPALRERARACEALRRLPDETLKDFHAHGLLRGLQPRRWGGFELDPWTFYEAVMEVAAVCGSSGWVLGC